ncbi:type I restriction enzyme, S subunit [Pseudobutyrivibrio sp. ACV-2]|uniref:restriction endonuclease subunit S n=1 Tax=Pseudobutyrivibrio sp. ACV-2 TaxID=1520801 RepID=UPI00089BFDB7|nr:restriction endonuclease subunit S [Pseudobutyrivibrio sp. ACV-2]SEA88966.1 type I restriction enzyme, S subunit [Pseudobutyrivibrio sp. ACV-2]
MREMRDSGVEWIGKIPENWIKTSLLNMLKTKICDGPHETPELTEDGIPFISVDSLNDSKTVNLDSAKKCISNELYEEYYKKAPLEEGDILFSKAATIGKTAIVDNRKFMVWSPLAIIKVDANKCDNTYLYYVLNCEDLIKYVSLLGGYNTQINVGMRTLEKAQIPVPPIDEQKRIVEYLDSKCSKIDVILSKQEAIIEKLKEYKLSVITEAVTKGLNPDVEMKDCGDLRIGYIPITWDKVKITRLLDYTNSYPIGDGDHGLIKTEDYKDEGVPYIRVQNLGWGTELNLDNVIYISEEDNERIKNSELHPNDVLFCKTGATIGKTGIVPKDLPRANTTSHVGKITIDDKYNARFVFYYLSSEVGYEQFWDIACMKSTRPELSIEETKAINICIPRDRKDQDEIVEYLDLIIPEIDLRIRKAEAITEKISEYKKSLIYEVVTGKREV